MADWFKFYSDFFDHPRFQYAIHQMSEVCPVTVLLLTEHCRHRSDTIRWTGDEIDLLGFSAKINVSPAKINEAIKLLIKIRFISIEGDQLKFLKWNDLQSEYCRKDARKKAKKLAAVSGHTPDTDRTNGHRGEEKRVEETAPYNPPVVERPLGKHVGDGGGIGDVNKLRQRLYVLFNRPETDPLSFMEEQSMACVVKRPDWAAELELVERYWKKIPPERVRYEPKTLLRLVEDWSGMLDKARAAKRAIADPEKPKRVPSKYVFTAPDPNGREVRFEYDANNPPNGKPFADGQVPLGLQMNYAAWLEKWKAQNP